MPQNHTVLNGEIVVAFGQHPSRLLAGQSTVGIDVAPELAKRGKGCRPHPHNEMFVLEAVVAGVGGIELGHLHRPIDWFAVVLHGNVISIFESIRLIGGPSNVSLANLHRQLLAIVLFHFEGVGEE